MTPGHTPEPIAYVLGEGSTPEVVLSRGTTASQLRRQGPDSFAVTTARQVGRQGPDSFAVTAAGPAELAAT